MKSNRRRKAQIKATAQRTAPVSMMKLAEDACAIVRKHRPFTGKVGSNLLSVTCSINFWDSPEGLRHDPIQIRLYTSTLTQSFEEKTPGAALKKMSDYFKAPPVVEGPSDVIVDMPF